MCDFFAAGKKGGGCYLLTNRYKYIYLASKRSERDTYRGNTIENRGCLLASERGWIMQNQVYVICMYVGWYRELVRESAPLASLALLN